MNLRYIDVSTAIKIQDEIISISGGLKGIKNIGGISSVLEHIQNDLYYPTFIKKITHLSFEINKGHPFQDGNKRSSIALPGYFLKLNGYNGILIGRFIREMENLVVQNLITKNLLEKIIYSLLYEFEYSNSLKLEIYNSISK